MKEPRGVAFPEGFRAVAVEAAIKKPGRKDLVVILSDRPAASAAVFTTNRFAAAPVIYSRGICERRDHARAILVNSGNANAGTGNRGMMAARQSAEHLAALMKFSAEEVLVASTGVIGREMPLDRIKSGIDTAAILIHEQSDGEAAAKAIMTTDTVEKLSERMIGDVRIGGMAKGSGMIHPNMATMLGFITTDAALPSNRLRSMLRRIVDRTFNAISVDNDMSTNDTVFLLANGAAGPIDEHIFEEALEDLCRELAMKIVADGEGATKVVTISVTGAAWDSDAVLAAEAIATSMLVKTALNGNDPNWGRILAAVGRSGARMDLAKIRIELAGFVLFTGGEPAAADLGAVSAAMKAREVAIAVDLGLGEGVRTVYTTDLSREYVSINADYTT